MNTIPLTPLPRLKLETRNIGCVCGSFTALTALALVYLAVSTSTIRVGLTDNMCKTNFLGSAWGNRGWAQKEKTEIDRDYSFNTSTSVPCAYNPNPFFNNRKSVST